MKTTLRMVLFFLLFVAGVACAAPADELIKAARAQIGVTTSYDNDYQQIPFPNGDVDPSTGVCTDVVIRAYRQAFHYDLQKAVNEDMQRAFKEYPSHWGHKSPDSNIDHRRVPNLQTFFERKGAELPVTDDAKDYLPGDIVTQMVSGNLPHIVIVSDRLNFDKSNYLVIHNIGRGTREEDMLFEFPITGHYRYFKFKPTDAIRRQKTKDRGQLE